MHLRRTVSLVLLAASTAAPLTGGDTLPKGYPLTPGPFRPTWDSLTNYKCPEWFRDAKFGIWAHWGPQSVPEDGDWYARKMYQQGNPKYKYNVEHYGHPSKFGYKDIIALWKAEKFDPDHLMSLYAKAGAKYFVSLGAHHDNFDLWNSRYHHWNAVEKGPHKDIVGLWEAAARKYGLKFGVSEHVERAYSWLGPSHGADKTGPLAGVPYDGNDPKYADLYFPPHSDWNQAYPVDPPAWWKQEWFDRIKDLIDNYHPDLLYTDGGIPFGVVGRTLVADFYNGNIAAHDGKLEAVYNIKRRNHNRAGEFMDGVAVEDLERGTFDQIMPEPWQTDTSVGDWFYQKGYPYKSTADIIHLLVDIVSKNGNLLINFTQRPDGTLDPQCLQILSDLAEWMPINGEAIYGTRPWITYGEGPDKSETGGHFNESKTKYDARDIRFTRKGETVYAIFLGWPGDGAKVTIRALASGHGPEVIHSVTLLGAKEEPAFTRSLEGLTVTLPDKAPCKWAVALRID